MAEWFNRIQLSPTDHTASFALDTDESRIRPDRLIARLRTHVKGLNLYTLQK